MDIPEPFVPPTVDLKTFRYTPIFRSRLFGSTFHAIVSDAGWRAGVTLWLKSWDQVPAGSLPSDEVQLCRLAELGKDVKVWRKVAKDALHGWQECSDGRLYHKVVAEVVMEAWNLKQEQRDRTEKARATRLSQSGKAHVTRSVTDPATFSVTDVVTDVVADSVTGHVTFSVTDIATEDVTNHVADDVTDAVTASNRIEGKGIEGNRIERKRDSRTNSESHSENLNLTGRASALGGSEVVFAGSVIRLTDRDFSAWSKTYWAIPDLRAELETLDAFYRDLPSGDQKRWFVRCSAALDKRHQDHVAKQKSEGNGLEKYSDRGPRSPYGPPPESW